jgi:hypothetical protein
MTDPFSRISQWVSFQQPLFLVLVELLLLFLLAFLFIVVVVFVLECAHLHRQRRSRGVLNPPRFFQAQRNAPREFQFVRVKHSSRKWNYHQNEEENESASARFSVERCRKHVIYRLGMFPLLWEKV